MANLLISLSISYFRLQTATVNSLSRTVSVVRSKHTNTFKPFLAALISFFTFSTIFFVFPESRTEKIHFSTA